MLEGNTHIHALNDGQIDVTEALSDLKTIAKIANSTPAAIVQEVRQTLTNQSGSLWCDF